MEQQKKNKTALLLFVLIILVGMFILYFQMWMPKPAKEQMIKAKDSVVSMVTGKKVQSKAADKKTTIDTKSKTAKTQELEEGKSGEKADAKSDTLTSPSSETDPLATTESKEGVALDKAPSETADIELEKESASSIDLTPSPDVLAESKVDDAKVPGKPQEADVAKLESDKSQESLTKQTSKPFWFGKVVEHIDVKFNELSPEAFFKKPPYFDPDQGLASYLLAVKFAANTAASIAATEEDKAYAGTAYFTSIEASPKVFRAKNPFEPLVKEDESATGRTGARETVEDVPVSDSSSLGWSGSGRIGSTDIWSDFATPRIPRNGSTRDVSGQIPVGDFTGNGGFAFPMVYPDGTFLIDGSPVIVKGIARSTQGCSALLQVMDGAEERIIRVRIGTILEGRYKVKDIDDKLVLISDTVSGETYRLVMGAPTPIQIVATDSAKPAGNSPMLITDVRG